MRTLKIIILVFFGVHNGCKRVFSVPSTSGAPVYCSVAYVEVSLSWPYSYPTPMLWIVGVTTIGRQHWFPHSASVSTFYTSTRGTVSVLKPVAKEN